MATIGLVILKDNYYHGESSLELALDIYKVATRIFESEFLTRVTVCCLLQKHFVTCCSRTTGNTYDYNSQPKTLNYR